MRLIAGLIVAVTVLASGASAQAQTHNFGPAIGATLPAIQARIRPEASADCCRCRARMASSCSSPAPLIGARFAKRR